LRYLSTIKLTTSQQVEQKATPCKYRQIFPVGNQKNLLFLSAIFIKNKCSMYIRTTKTWHSVLPFSKRGKVLSNPLMKYLPLLVLFMAGPTPWQVVRANSDTTQGASIEREFGKLQLAFEENRGQADPSVKFLTRGAGFQLFFTQPEAVFVLDRAARSGKSAVVRLSFDGARRKPKLTGGEALALKTNYFMGNGPSEQISNVVNHTSLTYESIYQGIDIVYYGNRQQLEYDFIVAPRADVKQIKMRFTGAESVRLTAEGELIVNTAAGPMIHRRPVAYQDINGKRQQISVKYRISSDRRIAMFDVGSYDAANALVIDPVVVYITSPWGTVSGVATDADGNTYVAGSTGSATLPAISGGYQTSFTGSSAAYLIKLDPTGSKALFATYLAIRNASVRSNGLAVDKVNRTVFLYGRTNSTSFPVTAGAYQTTKVDPYDSSFITKFNATASALVYSTFVPKVNISSLVTDATGNAFFTGDSGAMTATPGAYQTNGSNSAFAAKLNATGSARVYATFIPETQAGTGIAVDQDGNAYVTGSTGSPAFPVFQAFQPTWAGGYDGFVVKLNSTGSALAYASYIGGAAEDLAKAIAVTPTGEAVIVGRTMSENFPTTPGVLQGAKGYPGYAVSNAFVTKLKADGQLAYSSYLGGSWCNNCSAYADQDAATGVAVDAAGHAYVTGYAGSKTFPSVDQVYPTPTDLTTARYYAGFIAKINPVGTRLIYSTLIGPRLQQGNENLPGVSADAAGNAYVFGTTNAAPTANVVGGDGAGYVAKFAAEKNFTTLVSFSNPAVRGTAIVLAALVSHPTPNGKVTFKQGELVLGEVDVINGLATIETTLAPGVYKLTASYSLDGKSSLPVYQIVNGK
jgi:hypothetical protein